MAILTNFPAIRPSLLLDFANSRRADPRLSVVRSTTGTIISAGGQLEVVPANSPRIDFDPVTGRCLGLLVEESRTNLLTYSNDFTNAAWTKTRASAVSAGDWINLVEDNSPATSHSTSRSITPSGSTTYTFSVDIKAKERKFAAVAWSGSAQQVAASTLYINLENGATSGGIAGSFRLVRLTDGGWRVSIATTTIASPTGSIGANVFSCATLGSLNYDGDGVSGIYIRYAQAEVGSFPTSYIPTTTAQVTRAADLPTMYGAPIGQSAGTFLATASSFGANNTDRRLVTASSGGLTNLASLYFAVSGVSASIVQSGGVFQYGAVESAVIPGQSYQKALAYEAGNMRAATTGVLAAASSSSVLAPAASIDRLDIGHRLGNQILNGHIARIAYYSTRLPDAQLQRLTA